jgi:hypothetical protein
MQNRTMGASPAHIVLFVKLTMIGLKKDIQ